MLNLSNVLMIICITLGFGLLLNAYYKGKRVLQKIREKTYPKSLSAE